MFSAALGKTMAISFIIITNLAVTTLVSGNNIRADHIPKRIFITEQKIQFASYCKITLSLQNFKLIFIELTKHV